MKKFYLKDNRLVFESPAHEVPLVQGSTIRSSYCSKFLQCIQCKVLTIANFLRCKVPTIGWGGVGLDEVS